MKTNNAVQKQLHDIGDTALLFNRAERRELAHILFEDEVIKHIIDGRYSGGFAILVATDRRILLVDKKPFFLTLEDIRYDMISDVMFNNRLLNSSLLLGTFHKSIRFMAFSQAKIRNLTSFIQEKVMEVRSGQQQQTAGAVQPDVQKGALGLPIKQGGQNPYNMPVMIRRRATKNY